MKIVSQAHLKVLNNLRRGALLSEPLGAPGGAPQGKTKLSSDPYSASDYTTFTALRYLISSQHTHIFFLSMAEGDAYGKDFIRLKEGGPKWPPRSTKLSAEPTKQSSEPNSASDYSRLRALRALIIYDHTT